MCIGRDFSFAARLWERYVEGEKQAAKKRQHEEKKAKEKAAATRSSGRRIGGGGQETRAGGGQVRGEEEAPYVRHCGYHHRAQRLTLLTLVNAADLLERNTYVTPAQKRQQGAKKEPVVKVSRTRGDGVVGPSNW